MNPADARTASRRSPAHTRRDGKALGVYYTPPEIAAYLVEHTVGAWLRAHRGWPRILDPACGTGALLIEAWRRIRREYPSAQDCLFGIDVDAAAVQSVRAALPYAEIHCGDALAMYGGDKPRRSPIDDCYDIVLGNPPWGQKAIQTDPQRRRAIQRQFPSSAGIFDLFRPFVELGVRLTTDGGIFGMVLPDIILLKNYPQTRRFLLDQLAIDAIDWWGQAFSGAVIDAVTIIGRKRPARSTHRVQVAIRESSGVQEYSIPQMDFLANPDQRFNLFLTPARRRLLDRLADCPRLGDCWEIHEGIHSGNIRERLFVAHRMDATCRPLLFGRDEIAPYVLRWAGKFVRLGALPARRTPLGYANLGRREWHEQAKVLVRRTGDRVLAAVDREQRFASNNFFLVFPKGPSPLNLDALCALLNSRFMTWYFRTIEPRQGRVFAELKIKHLRVFPLPARPEACDLLNELGARRAQMGCGDEEIDAAVAAVFGLDPSDAV